MRKNELKLLRRSCVRHFHVGRSSRTTPRLALQLVSRGFSSCDSSPKGAHVPPPGIIVPRRSFGACRAGSYPSPQRGQSIPSPVHSITLCAPLPARENRHFSNRHAVRATLQKPALDNPPKRSSIYSQQRSRWAMDSLRRRQKFRWDICHIKSEGIGSVRILVLIFCRERLSKNVVLCRTLCRRFRDLRGFDLRRKILVRHRDDHFQRPRPFFDSCGLCGRLTV